MFNWLFGPKEHWRLVKTFTQKVCRSSPDENGIAYYHLFESNKKNRRVEFNSTLYYSMSEQRERSMKNLSIYQEKIYRWECGRVDPEIPTYNEIPEEDTANVLRGKIS